MVDKREYDPALSKSCHIITHHCAMLVAVRVENWPLCGGIIDLFDITKKCQNLAAAYLEISGVSSPVWMEVIELGHAYELSLTKEVECSHDVSLSILLAALNSIPETDLFQRAAILTAISRNVFCADVKYYGIRSTQPTVLVNHDSKDTQSGLKIFKECSRMAIINLNPNLGLARPDSDSKKEFELKVGVSNGFLDETKVYGKRVPIFKSVFELMAAACDYLVYPRDRPEHARDIINALNKLPIHAR